MDTTTTTKNPRRVAARKAYWAEPVNRYMQGERMRERWRDPDCKLGSPAWRQQVSERMRGAGNPNARRWIVIEPSGKAHRNVTFLRQFCEEHGISYRSFLCNGRRDGVVQRGGAKGWNLLPEEAAPA